MSAGVSIVIAVRDRPGLTEACLETVLAQPECGEAEIVVVDDGSGPDTRRLVGSYGERIRTRRFERPRGFAAAANAGAEIATGGELVFLNNDTRPAKGWLEALRRHAAENPRAAVVGSRLLYPDGTIQHAGVVLCRDGWPRHLYAGFPGDHPAVTRSRQLQAVTAACALVRRGPFERLGGFDEEFVNGLEDVDLCLRLAEAGFEIHYCGASVVNHLEYATREPGSADARAGESRFRSRWLERLVPDDLERFAEDGLLEMRYGDTFPARLAVSPLLAAIEDDGREREANWLLNLRSRQAHASLREAVRLLCHLADARPAAAATWNGPTPARTPDTAAGRGDLSALLAEAHEELRRRDEALAVEIHALQRALAENAPADAPEPSAALGYPAMLARLRGLVREVTPPGANVIVVSRGDDDLLRLDGRQGWHFPQARNGTFTGSYPADSEDAVEQLEALRHAGGDFLVFPQTAIWWLEHYRRFREHLDRRFSAVATADDTGVVYDLRDA